jgi:hypothetical protein
MADKKKPKPGPSTGGSSTSRIKKPKGSQPLTLGTGGLRTSKISKKQQAGTRKVVGNIALAAVGGGVGGLMGKQITKNVAKSARNQVAATLNKSAGAGKMTYPKAPTGVKKPTAPKRDVVVKTSNYEKSVIKTTAKKPNVRTVKPEVTKKQADRYTSQASNMRRKKAIKDADKVTEAVSQSKLLRNYGRVGGASTVYTGRNIKQSKKK